MSSNIFYKNCLFFFGTWILQCIIYVGRDQPYPLEHLCFPTCTVLTNVLLFHAMLITELKWTLLLLLYIGTKFNSQKSSAPIVWDQSSLTPHPHSLARPVLCSSSVTLGPCEGTALSDLEEQIKITLWDFHFLWKLKQYCLLCADVLVSDIFFYTSIWRSGL